MLPVRVFTENRQHMPTRAIRESLTFRLFAVAWAGRRWTREGMRHPWRALAETTMPGLMGPLRVAVAVGRTERSRAAPATPGLTLLPVPARTPHGELRSQRAGRWRKGAGEGNVRWPAQDPTQLQRKGRTVQEALLKGPMCDLRLKDESR